MQNAKKYGAEGIFCKKIIDKMHKLYYNYFDFIPFLQKKCRKKHKI